MPSQDYTDGYLRALSDLHSKYSGMILAYEHSIAKGNGDMQELISINKTLKGVVEFIEGMSEWIRDEMKPLP